MLEYTSFARPETILRKIAIWGGHFWACPKWQSKILQVQKMGQKVPGPKIHNNHFLLAKGPLPYDQKKFLVYCTNMTKMRR